MFDRLFFDYFLQLLSVGLTWKSVWKSSEKSVNQNYAILFLSWVPFSHSYRYFEFYLGIERNEIGNTMKAHMNTMGLIDKCIKSLSTNAPTVETVLMLKADDVFWKEFVSKPGE